MDLIWYNFLTLANYLNLRYNQRSHPLPFMKASSVAAAKMLSKDKPDLEEAIDESDTGEDLATEKLMKQEEEEEMDISKDKYVKQPKKKAKNSKKAASKAGKAGKAKGENEELNQTDSEDVKPAKSRGKAKGKSKK